MKKPAFLEGVAVAAILSLAASAVFMALLTLFPAAWVLRAVIAGVGLGYVVYLLARSPGRAGRVTALTVWALAAAGAWLLQPSLLLYVLVHVLLVWLIRALYHHRGPLSALADLALNALALAAAAWAGSTTGSVFLAFWCFLLVQALFVHIPGARATGAQPDPAGREDRFEQAHRAAESAIRNLCTIR